jgi:hypothetical protein
MAEREADRVVHALHYVRQDRVRKDEALAHYRGDLREIGQKRAERLDVLQRVVATPHISVSARARDIRPPGYGQCDPRLVLYRRWVRPSDAGSGKRMEQRLPASDQVIGHIVAMHLPRVASNEVAGLQ